MTEELLKMIDLLDRLMKPARDKLKPNVSEWLSTRNETIATLEKIIELLHKTTKDVAISNTVGSSVGVLGGIIIIGGLIAAPFTAGASLIPSAIAGGVTGGLGGVTAIGSEIAGLAINSQQDAQVKICIENDKNQSEKLQEALDNYRKEFELARDAIGQSVHLESDLYKASIPDTAAPRFGCNVSRLVAGMATGGTVTVSRIGSAGARMAARGTFTGARAVAMVATHVFTVLGLGLDVAMIAYNGVKLGGGAKSAMGIKLEEAVKELKEERDKYIKEFLED